MIHLQRSKRISQTLSTLLFVVLIAACSTTSTLQHPTTSATLWVQNAAEYQALTTSVYNTATSNLGLALEDKSWTAYPDQEKDNNRQKSPAIILDVDETVLDNSAFQARMIKQNKSYDPELWNSWVMEAQADPIPGALAFTKRAAKEGIAIYYLTNREAKVEEGTRENLRKLGFPLSPDEDRILSNNERESWTSAKTERRAYVADKHRILMLLGDNLNDFVLAEDKSQKERAQLVEKHSDEWGQRWYVLPNPVYGSWESALYNSDNSLSPSEIEDAKENKLDTKSQ